MKQLSDVEQICNLFQKNANKEQIFSLFPPPPLSINAIKSGKNLP